MIQTVISASTYQANILAALQKTGIANTAVGGKARAFCDIVGDQLGILVNQGSFSRGEQYSPARLPRCRSQAGKWERASAEQAITALALTGSCAVPVQALERK